LLRLLLLLQLACLLACLQEQMGKVHRQQPLQGLLMHGLVGLACSYVLRAVSAAAAAAAASG
jgi:hypothetical protein